MEITISAATAEQLIFYATKVANLDMDSNLSLDDMKAFIGDAVGSETIIIPDHEQIAITATKVAEAQAAGKKAKPRTKKKKDDDDKDVDPDSKVTLTIHASETDGGDVTIGVNGQVMRIPRNKEVEVPYKYFIALKNAKRQTPVRDANGAVVDWREVAKYSFSKG